MSIAAFQETSPGPRRPASPEPGEGPRREPVFNAPGPVLLLLVLILGGYAAQQMFPPETTVAALAFSPLAMSQGRWWTLVTALFLHGSWAHAGMNGAFALAFGAPVARYLGPRFGDAVLFFLFYVLCGVVSNLGYGALHLGSPDLLVGASGAISGLMGAASRLVAGHGRLGPILSAPVLGMGASWVIVNVLIALLGSGFMPGSGGAQVAWQAHLIGFVAGVLLIGPLTALMRRA